MRGQRQGGGRAPAAEGGGHQHRERRRPHRAAPGKGGVPLILTALPPPPVRFFRFPFLPAALEKTPRTWPLRAPAVQFRGVIRGRGA